MSKYLHEAVTHFYIVVSRPKTVLTDVMARNAIGQKVLCTDYTDLELQVPQTCTRHAHNSRAEGGIKPETQDRNLVHIL